MITVGTIIDERYEIIGNVGSGGMANVYLAKDLILNREVAVKVLRFDFQDDQDAIRRFRREALAATELVHPNIVGVYDVGEENGMQYIVMEYVRGTDLKHYIHENPSIPLEKVVDIMGQILSAISLAHQHRIIHRDLKPQNILMDENGVAKITDFGIAIALSETSITQTNTLLGSVHYLSPEQARGGMATRQSDIYALGIILYEMLIGEVPFEGESAVSIALKHFQNDIPFVRDHNPAIPQPLENVVLHATAKEIADRYVSVDEMYADLRTSLNPERANEPRFVPTVMTDETRAITPLQPEAVSAAAEPPQTETAEAAAKKPPKKKKSRKKKVIIFAVLALAVIGAVFFLAQGREEIRVPDVTDMTRAEAIEVLEKAKLQVDPNIEEIASDEIEEGRIVKTDPAAKSMVKENARITLFVSIGSKNIKMKDYTGWNVDEAISDLVQQGFKSENIKTDEVYDESAERDTIVKQSIRENAEVSPEKSQITFSVSKGPESFVLEDMTGYSRSRVAAYLQSVGLTMVEGAAEHSETIAEGQLLYSVPGGGVSVQKGDTVTVVFSAGPKAPETTETSAPETSETTTPPTSDTKTTEPNDTPQG